MRIGIDGNKMVCGRGEESRRSRVLAGILSAGCPDDSFTVYTPELKGTARLQHLRTRGNVEFRVPAPQSFHGSMWRAFGIPTHLRSDRIDVYHGIDGILPLNIRSSRVPAVVTVDNLSWLRHPETLGGAARVMKKFLTLRACKAADRIIVPDEKTADDLTTLTGIDSNKIAIISPFCEDEYFQTKSRSDAEAKSRFKLPERYIFLADIPSRHSGTDAAIRAMQSISPDMSLVTAGSSGKMRSSIEAHAKRLGIEHRIIFADTDSVDSDAEETALRASLCRLAEVALSLSTLDSDRAGFVSAMATGTPVIAADGDGREETGGPDVYFIDPSNTDEIIEAVHALLSDPASSRQMGESAREYAARYSGAESARLHRRLYASLV